MPSNMTLFRGTIEECQAHVAALKKNVKGYRYRIRGRGPRVIHTGKRRIRLKAGVSVWNRHPTDHYTAYALRLSLPLSFAAHGIVYDNLRALSLTK